MMLKIRTVACLIKVINNLLTLYQQSKESINIVRDRGVEPLRTAHHFLLRTL